MQYADFVELLAQELLLDPARVQPDALLAAGLGVRPMDLMQLVERLEPQLGTPLMGIDLHAVDTVEELYWEIVAGGDDGGDSVVAARASHARTAAAAPHEVALRRYLPNDVNTDVTTMVGVLTRRAAVTPDREALTFPHTSLTCRQLARGAAQVAAALLRHGVGPGDRVVLVHDHAPGFFFAFWGIQLVRATVVPLSGVPRPERIAAVARHVHPIAILTGRPLARPLQRRLEEGLADHHPAFLSVTELQAEHVDLTRPLPQSAPGDLAMLQFTSGTTGDPRGVMLTQAALLANVRQIIPAARLHREDVVVSWLPVWHDLGLIALTLCPLYVGARVVLRPARLDPHDWLSAIAQYRGSVTAAPDFAYRYALRFGGNLDRYDLSSLRLALVAGEPVRHTTLTRFEAELELRGVCQPGYGLAECAVGVTLHTEPPTADAQGHVCVGRPLPGVEVQVRGANGMALPVGAAGEVCVRSPAQTVGYFRNPEATATLFTADGWVRTGDRGVLDGQGRLTIIGRDKDLIITGGRPVAPAELEVAAETVEGVSAAGAIGLDAGGEAGEQVHLVVETPLATGWRHAKLALMQAVRTRIQERLDLRVTRVHLVGPGALPRTENGKRSRALLRGQLLAGTLD